MYTDQGEVSKQMRPVPAPFVVRVLNQPQHARAAKTMITVDDLAANRCVGSRDV